METKKCNKCGVVKPLCEFSKNKSMKDGLLSRCNACRKAYREANKEKIAERGKAYRKENKDKITEQKKAHYRANKDKILKQRKAYEEANKEKIAERGKAYREANKEKFDERLRAYYQANKDKIAEQKRAYYKENKDEINKRSIDYHKKRMATDPAFKMRRRISGSVSKALKKQGKTKGGSTFSALPYTPLDLVEHIEKQFDETMTWDNYGSYWDLDHIYPQSLLPYTSLEDENFQKCWALNNLQPLEKMANIRKGNKVVST
jgi:hypothetical protein